MHRETNFHVFFAFEKLFDVLVMPDFFESEEVGTSVGSELE